MVGIYQSLVSELDLVPTMPNVYGPVPGVVYTKKDEPMRIESLIHPHVMAALIDAATRIAMATDTRDMGIMTIPGTNITRVVTRDEMGTDAG